MATKARTAKAPDNVSDPMITSAEAVSTADVGDSMPLQIDPPPYDPAANANALTALTAERAYKAYAAVLEADAHFKTCQSVSFRQHVRSILTAPNVKKAFEDLKAQFE